MELTPTTVNQALSYATKGDRTALEALSKKFDLARCIDRYGATVIHYAARAGRTGLLAWLVQTVGLSGSKDANNGATAAHDAAATGQLESLQWLIQYGGCSATYRDASLATPLHLASRFNKVSVVIWLVEAENCNPVEKAKGGITPLHLAAARGSFDTVRWLAQYCKSAVDRRADNGATPLYFAVQEGHLECSKFLANQVDANCRLRATDGMAPIHAAAQMGKLDCLVWLVEECKIPISERDNDGATPLHYAAARGHLFVLEWLLTHNASMEQDDLGGTPLHDAAEHGQLEAIKVMISYGADPHIQDSDGLTPADLAEDCDYNDCSTYLKNQPEKNTGKPTVAKKPIKGEQKDQSISGQPFPSLVQSAIEVCKPTTQSLPLSRNTSLSHSASVGHIKSPTHSFQLSKSITSSRLGQNDDELTNKFKRMQAHRPIPISEMNEDSEPGDYNTQNPQLLEEVRLYEKSDLGSTPTVKRNLQPFKYGKVASQESPNLLQKPPTTSASINASNPPTNDSSSHKEMSQQGRGTNGRQDKEDMATNDVEEKIPLWKRSLVRKKEKEEQDRTKTDKEAAGDTENKWSGVPAWKKNILVKKEEERAKQRAVEDEERRLEEIKQARFDALPDWKRKILINKKEGQL